MTVDSLTIVGSVIVLVVAVIVCVILSFTQTRTNKNLTFCWELPVPGIVYPINYLNPRHRLVYVLACTALASQLLNLIIFGSSFEINKWAAVFVNDIYIVFFVLVQVIITYPLLACVEAPIPLVGYILGAIYTDIYFIWLIANFATAIKSISGSNFDTSLKRINYSSLSVTFLPQIGCLVGVLIWYHYKLIKELMRLYRTGSGWKLAILNQPTSENEANYVKELFKRNPQRVKKYVVTGLQLPLPVMIAAAVAALMVFQATVIWCFSIPPILSRFGQLFGNVSTKIANSIHTASAITVIAPILSFVISCGLFIHFIYSIRLKILELRKSLFQKPIKWPTMTLSSSVRYTGYQVAAILIAWLIHTIVILVILLAVMAVIFFPSIFGYYLYRLCMTVIWLLLILGAQILVCKLFFINNDSSSLQTVILDNRRLFNLFSYIMFLYNIATGVMSAVLRVGLSFLFMILVLPRMDRLIYVKGFELFDLGHSMFNNFLIMEVLLHNPIVHVFVNILDRSTVSTSDNHSTKAYVINSGSSSVPKPSRTVRSRRGYNRWFVAYTLIKNPSLRKCHQTMPTDQWSDKEAVNQQLQEFKPDEENIIISFD